MLVKMQNEAATVTTAKLAVATATVTTATFAVATAVTATLHRKKDIMVPVFQ